MLKAKPAEPAKTASRRFESRALDHRPASFERARVAGFAFTPEDDDLFAYGYPHLCLLYDDERDPREAAADLLNNAFPYQTVHFPREAAAILARTIPGGPIHDFSHTEPPKLNARVRASIARTDPLTAEELPTLVATLLRIVSPSTDVLLFIYEALFGTIAVASSVVTALEAFPASDRGESSFFRMPPNMARTLDALVLMLDRAPEVEAATWLERLRRFVDGLGLEEPRRTESGVGVVHHEALVAPPRIIVRAEREALVRARAATRKQAWYSLPDPRLVFLGGEEVYDIELPLWPKYKEIYTPGEAHRLTLERFGRIRSSKSVELVVAMLAKSRAKAEALEWLRRHETFARETLAAMVERGDDLSAAAALALTKI